MRIAMTWSRSVDLRCCVPWMILFLCSAPAFSTRLILLVHACPQGCGYIWICSVKSRAHGPCMHKSTYESVVHSTKYVTVGGKLGRSISMPSRLSSLLPPSSTQPLLRQPTSTIMVTSSLSRGLSPRVNEYKAVCSSSLTLIFKTVGDQCDYVCVYVSLMPRFME